MPAPLTAPPVSVVITHYRSPDVLLHCLDAIAASGSERLGEVLVIDSEAQPGLGDRLSGRHPDVRYVPVPRNVGFGALVNRGLLGSTSPYVLVLNADIVVDPPCIDTLARHLDADPTCGLVAPLLRNPDGSLQHTAFRFHRPTTIAYRRTPLGRTGLGRAELARFLARDHLERAVLDQAPVPSDWVLGAAMCVRREALADVGEMDAAYFLYFEDVDWCLRFWQSGWRVTYLPTAGCLHGHERASARGGALAALVNPLTRRHLRSALRFFVKHGLRVERPGHIPAPRTPLVPAAPTTAAEPERTPR